MSTKPKLENTIKRYGVGNNYVRIREILELFQIIKYNSQTDHKEHNSKLNFIHSLFAQFNKHSCLPFHSESRAFFTNLDDYRESEFLKQSKHVTSFETHGACLTFVASKITSKRQIIFDN